MPVETVTPLGETYSVAYVRDAQTTSPRYLIGTFVIDDNTNHDFKLDGRGKSKLSVFVQNPGDQVLTVSVYGMHDPAGDVGDVGVKQIGANFTVGTTDNEYRTVADPFPFYLVRVAPAAAATGSPTCTCYFDFHSGS